MLPKKLTQPAGLAALGLATLATMAALASRAAGGVGGGWARAVLSGAGEGFAGFGSGRMTSEHAARRRQVRDFCKANMGRKVG